MHHIQFLDFPPLNLSSPQDGNDMPHPTVCWSNWTDPTSHILTALNTMALLLSLSAANFPFRNTTNAPAAQVLTMQQTSNVNIYQSDYGFLIASTMLTTVFILLITPIFTGWGDLGRHLTLNPVETAKAFDAPLLQGPG